MGTRFVTSLTNMNFHLNRVIVSYRWNFNSLRVENQKRKDATLHQLPLRKMFKLLEFRGWSDLLLKPPMHDKSF